MELWLFGRCVKRQHVKNVYDLQKISIQFLLHELCNSMKPTNIFAGDNENYGLKLVYEKKRTNDGIGIGDYRSHCFYLINEENALYVIIMSRSRFRVNLHSI